MNGIMIKRFFETHFPIDLAYDWDNVGLQIGTLNKPINGILMTLDVTKEVVEEAIKKECNFIIAHHPLLFKPLKSIITDAYKGQLIEKIIKHDLTVYVAHTNFDLGHQGMNKVLADKLGLTNQDILEYETDTHGIGRIGDIKPMAFEDAIKHIKSKLNIPYARLIANKPIKTVKRIAISGGSGASHMFQAKVKHADLYLTGDVSYHQAHDMLQMGLLGLDVGHYAEKVFGEALKAILQKEGFDCPMYQSQVHLDPFTLV